MSNSRESTLTSNFAWALLGELMRADGPISMLHASGIRGAGGDPVADIKALDQAGMIKFTRLARDKHDKVIAATDDGMRIYKAAHRYFSGFLVA